MSSRNPKNKENRAPRSSKSQMTERVLEVYRMIIAGSSRTDLLQFTAKNYGLEARATDDLIAKARELQESNVKDRQESMLSECVSRYDDLYKEARAKDDLKSCIAINKELSELFHLKEDSSSKPAAVTITFSHGEEKVL